MPGDWSSAVIEYLRVRMNVQIVSTAQLYDLRLMSCVPHVDDTLCLCVNSVPIQLAHLSRLLVFEHNPILNTTLQDRENHRIVFSKRLR